MMGSMEAGEHDGHDHDGSGDHDGHDHDGSGSGSGSGPGSGDATTTPGPASDDKGGSGERRLDGHEGGVGMAKLIKMFRAHRGRRLDGHEGDDDGLAELMMMCEAMAEGDGPSADDMECLEACPKAEEVFLQVDAELEKS